MEFKFETEIKKSNVIHLKLNTLEEIIGRVEEVTDKDITLSHVYTFTLIKGQDGQPQMTLQPFMISVHPESKLVLNRNNILVKVYSNNEDTEKSYLELITGVELSTSTSSTSPLMG